MRVSLTEHGGLAAAVHRAAPARVADAGALPPAQARELARLVRAALDAPAGAAAGPGRARDAMSYTVTVEQDTGTTVLTGSDTAASAEFAELVQWLRQHT
ncbi:hypothetical protein Asp14428_75980 [Actinoplanes sp. NBRC 14428]|nr:hypothetical protein Asp14428_75980 [Actinoplanes sp. NBRC 14428]